jgi:hypothetical protein
MATARMLATPAWHSTTVRQFQKATVLALLAVGVGAVIYGVETFVLDSRHRFVENPADVMMRGFGLAHFWVGWLFLFMSPRLRSWPSLGNLAWWTAVGAGLCVLSYWSGGTKNPFGLMAFYAYFLIHEIRDEATLYRAYGEAPASGQCDGFTRRLAWSVTLSLMAMLATAYALHGRILDKLETAVATPEAWLWALVAGVWLVCAVSWRLTCRFARRHDVVWSDYRPLLNVYAGIALLLGVGSAFGSFGFNLIVLIHVAAWFVFTYDRLAQREAQGEGAVNNNERPSSRRSLWTWLRTAPAGFLTLHALAALVVLTLMALRVHLWLRGGWISAAFATSSFHYWSIMHITMAFWRGK